MRCIWTRYLLSNKWIGNCIYYNSNRIIKLTWLSLYWVIKNVKNLYKVYFKRVEFKNETIKHSQFQSAYITVFGTKYILKNLRISTRVYAMKG